MDNKPHERALVEYVDRAIYGNEACDERVLASLVTAAPGHHVLTPDEWWNVALLLAFWVRDDTMRPQTRQKESPTEAGLSEQVAALAL